MHHLLSIRLYVEAAGDLERALRLVPLLDAENGIDVETAESWRELVPRSHGGRCDDATACATWDLILQAMLRDPQTRRDLALLREELDEVEAQSVIDEAAATLSVNL